MHLKTPKLVSGHSYIYSCSENSGKLKFEVHRFFLMENRPYLYIHYIVTHYFTLLTHSETFLANRRGPQMQILTSQTLDVEGDGRCFCRNEYDILPVSPFQFSFGEERI